MRPLRRLLDFLHADLWRIRLRDQPRGRGFLLRTLRVITLSLRGFNEDKCRLRASALTFFTLMSIVPVLALAFAVAKTFNFEDRLRTKLMEMAQGQQEAFQRILGFADNMIEMVRDTSGGVMAGLGVVLLFWAVIKLLGNIEGSFNDIWGIKTPRPWPRKFADYLSFMIIAPVAFLLASSATVVVTSTVKDFILRLEFLGPLGALVIEALRILPFAVLWSLFTFMYIFMPNTRVRFGAALVAGIVAGSAFQGLQWLYVTLQIGAASANAIYGSFAALPLFLAWLQLSWFVVLYGAELSFALQHVDTYEFEPDCLTASPEVRRTIALGVVHKCIEQFKRAETASTADELAALLEAPSRLVHEVLHQLVEAGVLSAVAPRGRGDISYQPAQDIDNLTLENVLNLLDRRGNHQVPYHPTPAMEKIQAHLAHMREVSIASEGNVRLGEI